MFDYVRNVINLKYVVKIQTFITDKCKYMDKNSLYYNNYEITSVS